MIGDGRLTVTRQGRRVVVDLDAINTPESDTVDDIGTTKDDMGDKMAELVAELAQVKATLESVTQERDYLRQTLTREQELHAMSLTLTRQIDAPRGDPSRPWWRFW
jgi:chromosome segregation ATPase